MFYNDGQPDCKPWQMFALACVCFPSHHVGTQHMVAKIGRLSSLDRPKLPALFPFLPIFLAAYNEDSYYPFLFQNKKLPTSNYNFLFWPLKLASYNKAYQWTILTGSFLPTRIILPLLAKTSYHISLRY